jgi:hypothetical protein
VGMSLKFLENNTLNIPHTVVYVAVSNRSSFGDHPNIYLVLLVISRVVKTVNVAHIALERRLLMKLRRNVNADAILSWSSFL